jgi:nitrate/nitrite transporter NarK
MVTSVGRHCWFVLFLCTYPNIVLASINSAFAPILPIVREELGLTYTESGMFATAYFFGYTIGQIPWGYFADRYGGSKAITLSLFAASIMTLISGTMNNILGVIVWRFLTGLLGAGVFASGIRVISAWFPPRRRGSAIGFLGAGSSLGTIFVSYTFPLVVLSYSWRWCIWILAALGFLGAIASWIWLRDASSPKRTLDGGGEMRETISQPSFWLLGFDQFVRLGITYGLGAWLPTFLYEYYGQSLVWAGITVTIMNGVGILSNPVGGVASDSLGEISIILGSLAVMAPAFLVLAFTSNLALSLVLILLFGWFSSFFRSPIFAVLPKLYGLKLAGRTTGFQNTFASAGAVFFPFIIVVSRDYTTTFSFGWIFVAIFCGLGAVSTMLLRRSISRQANKTWRVDQD